MIHRFVIHTLTYSWYLPFVISDTELSILIQLIDPDPLWWYIVEKWIDIIWIIIFMIFFRFWMDAPDLSEIERRSDWYIPQSNSLMGSTSKFDLNIFIPSRQRGEHKKSRFPFNNNRLYKYKCNFLHTPGSVTPEKNIFKSNN